jgi:hypothetical protein
MVHGALGELFMIGTEYKDGDTVIVRHITREEAWQNPLQFFSKDEEFIQVGSWNYNNGKELLAHKHNVVPREVNWTQEVLFIWKGSIRAKVFNLSLKHVADIIAQEGDILIMLAGGHGYDILEDGTRVLEVKNGPYVGAEADRVRLTEGELAASKV